VLYFNFNGQNSDEINKQEEYHIPLEASGDSTSTSQPLISALGEPY
jgi:hypothetical protein